MSHSPCILFWVCGFERQYNPKLLPADSWYMKYQTSPQLVTEPLVTLPKLPTAVTSLLAQPTDPEWSESQPHGAGSQQGGTRSREPCSSAFGAFLTLRFSWAFRLVSLCDSHNSGSNCLFPMPSTEQSQAKLPMGSEGGVTFVTVFVFPIQFAAQSHRYLVAQGRDSPGQS